MNMQQFLEYFRRLPPSTQLAVIVGVLVSIVGVAVFPAAGTNLITFLINAQNAHWSVEKACVNH